MTLNERKREEKINQREYENEQSVKGFKMLTMVT